MSERINTPPREIKFYEEGKALDIKQGLAITTIRNPNDNYNFAPGEVILANCVDDKEKIRVVVIANKTETLNKFARKSPGVLALDGFFSADHAATEMRRYPGYEGTSTKSKMMAITFLSEESFESLTDTQRKFLLSRRIETSIKQKQFRPLFFPTMALHLANLGGSLNVWNDFLYIANSYISPSESNKLANHIVSGTNISRIVDDNQEMFTKLTRSSVSKSSLFKPLVLVDFD